MNPRFERGRILFMQRRYDLAAREFQEAIGIDPTLTAAQSMLALCLCELNKNKDSIATARAAIATNPPRGRSRTLPWRGLPFRCNRLKRRANGISQRIRLNPDDASYYRSICLNRIEFRQL